MNKTLLEKNVTHIATRGKGILAADESSPTIKKRFESIGLKSTEENRRNYRDLLFTTPGIEEFISGVILFEETLMQRGKNGQLFVEILSNKNIAPGIKVDKGKKGKGDEEITIGLEDLNSRIQKYKKYNPTFTKWRAVYHVSDSLPSDEIIEKNAIDLAEYAKIVQENDLIPIVEPEVLMTGNHSIERSYEVTKSVLKKVFEKLEEKNIFLPGIVLKPSMVIAGDKTKGNKVEEVAKNTLKVLHETVPRSVPTINFLSGGQTPEQATAHLSSMNKQEPNPPWNLSFSYGRALQEPPLKTWLGRDENIEKAQNAFYNTARLNSLAARGE